MMAQVIVNAGSHNPPQSMTMDALAAKEKAEDSDLPCPASASFSSCELPQSRLKTYLFTEVDPNAATVPLAAYCFMTGYTVAFSTVFVWSGFQTGNSLRLALALARLFEGPSGNRDASQRRDRQAFVSLVAFALGAALGRVGDRIGARTRAWLALGTVIQASFTLAAALALWMHSQANVADAGMLACLGLMSASLGLQGIMGRRMNTQFSTTIVLTAMWCELMAEPMLFNVRRTVRTRDHKLVAIGALLVGGFVSRVVMQAVGSPAALGIGTGLRVLIALAWLLVPAKEARKRSRGRGDGWDGI